jgi:hypothetical protein
MEPINGNTVQYEQWLGQVMLRERDSFLHTIKNSIGTITTLTERLNQDLKDENFLMIDDTLSSIAFQVNQARQFSAFVRLVERYDTVRNRNF